MSDTRYPAQCTKCGVEITGPETAYIAQPPNVTPLCVGCSSDGDVAVDPIPKTKLAIVGFSASSRDLVKQVHDDPAFEFWGMNSLWQFIPGPWHRWFEIHDEDHLKEIHGDVYPKVLKMYGEQFKEITLYMRERIPAFPSSVQYPLSVSEILGIPDIINDPTGRGHYYESTVGYALALALAEVKAHRLKWGSEGVSEVTARASRGFVEPHPWEEIHLYGIDMIHDSEWGHQRPNVEFYLGMAHAMGIKVHIPPESALLKPQWLYGFDPNPPELEEIQDILTHIDVRSRALDGQITLHQQESDMALLKKAAHDGAKQELANVRTMLVQKARGRLLAPSHLLDGGDQ